MNNLRPDVWTASPALSSGLSGEFTSTDVVSGSERTLIEDGAPSAGPSVIDRVNILGIGAMPLNLAKASATLERWRSEGLRKYVCVISVHGLVIAQRDPAIRSALNHCGMATEDGMPLVCGHAWQDSLEQAGSAARTCLMPNVPMA
jgi:UDP-N-acetyl-D-mannosaminuronic acid transferase (WecB/TagA/CpsF family)